MLGGRHDRIRPGEIIPLIALDHGGGEDGAEQRILTGTLGAAAPAGVARDVEHRGPGERDAVGRSLRGGDVGGAPDQRRIPGTGEAKRQWKDRAVAVDHVCREQ
jgi:hypothetical protein